VESGRGTHVHGKHTFFRPRYSSYARARERGALPPTFGPLHGRWANIFSDRACSNVSFILINSKNYAAAVNNDLAAHGCTPNEYNFKNIRDFVGKEIDCPDGTPKTVYLSIAQGFGPKRKNESYVNILPEGDKDVTFRNLRTFQQIAVVLKELGPETYKCLQDAEKSPEPMDAEESPDPMDVEDSDDPTDDEDSDNPTDDEDSDDPMDVEEPADPIYVSVHAAVNCPFLAEDEAKELGEPTRAATLPYLKKLRIGPLAYLDNVKLNLLTGVLESLPLVYRQKGMATKPRQEWRKAASEFSKGHA
jgi:hypothetical protein